MEAFIALLLFTASNFSPKLLKHRVKPGVDFLPHVLPAKYS